MANDVDTICMLILNEAVTDGRVMRSAEALSRRYDVRVVGWLRPERESRIQGSDLTDLPFDLQLIRLRTARLLPKNAIGYAARYVEAFVRMLARGRRHRPAVIHAHELATLPIGLALRALTGARLVYDAHELYREQAHWTGKRIGRWMGRMESRWMRRADAIIACNEHRARIMAEEYGAPFVPAVVGNMPPYRTVTGDGRLRRFAAERNPALRKIVVHPGGLLNRGIDTVLDAFARTDSSIGLVLIGQPEGYRTPAVDARIAELGLEGRVLFHGPVPYERLPDLMADADLGLLMYPNTCRNNYLCAPNKLFEFALCGLPTVAVDFPPCRAVFDRYPFGRCFAWDDPSDLARAVESCLTDDPAHAGMRSAALEAARELNWDREQQALIEVYDTLSPTRDREVA